MTDSNDRFWKDLGLTWSAIDPDIGAITPRLKSRLQRQSTWIDVAFVSACLAAVAGLVLGVWTIWLGWKTGTWHFVVRGIGVTAICTLSATAARTLLAVRSTDNVASLSDMLDLAIQRSRRAILLTRIGLWACGIAAAAGTIGTVARTRLQGPPRMSPVIDLLLLGLVAVVLYLAGRLFDANLARYAQLKRSVVDDHGRR
jgi:hypothetical protein